MLSGQATPWTSPYGYMHCSRWFSIPTKRQRNLEKHWKGLWVSFNVVSWQLHRLCEEENAQKQIKDFLEWVVYAKATLSHSAGSTNGISKLVSKGVYGFKYFFDSKSAIMQSKISLARAWPKEVKEFLSAADENIMTGLSQLSLPTLKSHKIIFIPKTDEEFNAKLANARKPEVLYEEYKSSKFIYNKNLTI